jgi:hypothetical protein
VTICVSTGVTSSASPSMNWFSRMGGSYVFVSYKNSRKSARAIGTPVAWVVYPGEYMYGSRW